MRAGNQMGHWSTARRGHQRTTDVVRSEGPTEEEAGYRSYKRARGELNAGGPCGRFLLERIRVTLQGGEARCRKLVTLGTGAGHNRVIQDQRDSVLEFHSVCRSLLLSPHVVFYSHTTRRLLIGNMDAACLQRDHRGTGTSTRTGSCSHTFRNIVYVTL